jgi:dephospho-CoA kinase
MKWFGLTGGIASGKSTVTQMFRDLGVEVIDADALAREVVAPGEPALASLVDAFGPEILLPDGTLDRAALGTKVFGDINARTTLNGILHPAIGARTGERLQEARARGLDMVLYDAALIVENGIHQMLDGLVVVTVDPATQKARLIARDGLSEAAAQSRIDSQLPAAEKLKYATWTVDNGGSLDTTRAQVVAVWHAMKARAASDAAP